MQDNNTELPNPTHEENLRSRQKWLERQEREKQEREVERRKWEERQEAERLEHERLMSTPEGRAQLAAEAEERKREAAERRKQYELEQQEREKAYQERLEESRREAEEQARQDRLNGIFVAPIGNYYGTPTCWKTDDGKFIFELECVTNRETQVEVSKEFYDAWAKEFGEPE